MTNLKADEHLITNHIFTFYLADCEPILILLFVIHIMIILVMIIIFTLLFLLIPILMQQWVRVFSM